MSANGFAEQGYDNADGDVFGGDGGDFGGDF